MVRVVATATVVGVRDRGRNVLTTGVVRRGNAVIAGRRRRIHRGIHHRKRSLDWTQWTHSSNESLIPNRTQSISQHSILNPPGKWRSLRYHCVFQFECRSKSQKPRNNQNYTRKTQTLFPRTNRLDTWVIYTQTHTHTHTQTICTAPQDTGHLTLRKYLLTERTSRATASTMVMAVIPMSQNRKRNSRGERRPNTPRRMTICAGH